MTRIPKMIEEITGAVVSADETEIIVRYDDPQRVQIDGFVRTVFSGRVRPSVGCEPIRFGDRVVCQIQRITSHASEPLIAVHKSAEC